MPDRKSRIHSAIPGKRSIPVLFEGQQAVCGALGNCRIEEKARVLDQYITRLCLRLPTQAAPNSLVHIVVRAVGIRNESCRVWPQIVLNELEKCRPWICRFPSQRKGKGWIPPGRLVLGSNRMGNIGVIAKTVALWQPRPCLCKRRTAGAADQSSQPIWHLLVYPVVNEIDLRFPKTLHR